MKNQKRLFFYGAMAAFGGLSLAILFFFLLFRLPELVSALRRLADILAPFLYGAVIAYLLRPLCRRLFIWLRRRFPKLRESAANALAVSTAIGVGILAIYLLAVVLVPRLYDSAAAIWDTLPERTDRFLRYWNENFTGRDELFLLLDRYSDTIYAAADSWVENTLVPNLTDIVSGVGVGVWKALVFLKNILIGFVAAFYILYHRAQFRRQGELLLRSVLRPRWADAVIGEVRLADRLFGGFVSGKLLDSAIVGVLCYVGCIALGFPDALLVSFIVGVTNVIPVFGPIIGAVPSALLILLETPAKVLWFLLFILALQQLDGHIIGPRILGERTGLSGFWVMFAIVLFGGLWGVVGMIVGVPLMAMLYDLTRRFVYHRLEKQRGGKNSARS